MNTDERQVRGKHDDLTQKIIGVFYDVYNELALLMNFGHTPRFKRLVMDNASKKLKEESVSIGVRPFADAEVAP